MRIALLTLTLASAAFGQRIGEPLPPWTPGTLDIHQINTGRGDSALLVFPDGTSMLVDAGDGGWGAPPRGVDPKPDGSRKAGEWIARYAKRVLAHDAEPQIDYGYLTHFHGDHMGGFDEVFEHIPIATMLDRGWPDYSYPTPLAGDAVDDYLAFVKSGELSVERFRPGRNDQIKLLRSPEKHPDFEVRNIAANGEVWTGVGTATRQHFPAEIGAEPPSENQCSMAVRISYGPFDYYTGGDMPGVLQPGWASWRDVETPVAKAVGPVEVVVPNHHGNRDSTNAFFVSALRPRLWILPVWSSDHPGHDVLVRNVFRGALSRQARRAGHQHARRQQARHRPLARPTPQRSGAHRRPRRPRRRDLPRDHPRGRGRIDARQGRARAVSLALSRFR